MIPFLKDTHYLVVGASSVTGRSLALFLSSQKASYSLSDVSKDFYQKLKSELTHPPRFVYDDPSQTESQLKEIDAILLSPGVPRSLPFLKKALDLGIPVIGEISFSLNYLKQQNITPTIIAVTGSNGKSTTCALTYHFLKHLCKNKNVYLLGNFKIPLSEMLNSLTSEDIIVLELSSYQLEDGMTYHIPLASIVNISPNHLDRYDSFKDYEKAKMNLLFNQTPNDKVVVPVSLLALLKEYKVKSQALLVDSFKFNPDTFLSLNESNDLYQYETLLKSDVDIPQHLIPLKDNILIAISMALNFGFSIDDILLHLKSFKGLEHRSEWVRDINGVTVINDSKATTPKAIELHLNYPVATVIIMGGKNKNLDFSYLKSKLNDHTQIVFYGDCGQDLQNQLGLADSIYTYKLKEAVLKAYELAKKELKSNLILSPGCTSFDQFTSFEQRGNFFKEVVYEIR